MSTTPATRPEDVWFLDREYADEYHRMVAVGREVAAETDVAIVGIARNARPFIVETLNSIAKVRSGFRSSRVYVFENDSTDGTNDLLDFHAEPDFTVEHEALGGVDSRGFEPERTVRLAYCRNNCHDWVRQNAAGAAWTIVLDMDPHGGFSIDGVFNSVGWMGTLSAGADVRRPGGMAAYSLYKITGDDGKDRIAHYDAWAMRPPSWWRDRRDEIGMTWASSFLPPVGSPPCPMNSAFGGLCVYSTEAFLAAGERPYEGGDCEHVFLHRKMHKAGYQLYLNPGCRYISIWQ